VEIPLKNVLQCSSRDNAVSEQKQKRCNDEKYRRQQQQQQQQQQKQSTAFVKSRDLKKSFGLVFVLFLLLFIIFRFQNFNYTNSM
jgi:Fe2+ transport system protein B